MENNPFEINAKYPFVKKVVYEIQWPIKLYHNSMFFFFTGKTGTGQDNCPSAEYSHNDRETLWLDLDGTIQDN